MAYIGNFPAEKYTTFSKQTFTPDGSTTSFTLDFSVANENDLELFVNNVRQEPGSGKAYTATGLTLTMSSAPGASDDMYAIFQGKAQQTVTPGPQTVTGSMLATDIAISTSGNITTTGNINLGDNDYINFGASNDLQIYHDGTHTTIKENNVSGNLYLQANNAIALTNNDRTQNFAQFFENGESNLWYNGIKKLATTSTGIDVTGTVTSDGLTVDTNTLHVNSTNNRVGIGTNSPGNTLDVRGNIFSYDGGTQGTLLSNSGSIEIARTDGDAYIDFKSTTSVDYDVRIQQATNGLRFITGGSGSLSERMRIDSSGNVGIGTSSPSAELHVKSSDNRAQINLENDVAQGAIRMEGINPVDGSDNLQITASTSGTNRGIYFTTSDAGTPSGKILFASNGNVGIGTTSPTETLQVTGNIYATTTIRANGGNTAISPNFAVDGGTGMFKPTGNSIAFSTTNNERMRIDTSGNVGIGTTPSSWGGTFKAIDINSYATFSADNDTAFMTANGYYNGTNWIYKNTNLATRYYQQAGNHVWSNASSSTAGDTITWLERMRIDSSGNVGIGVTSPSTRLYVHESTNTGSSSTGTTLLTLHNNVGSDLSEQKTFIDFRLEDTNSNEYPQVRIGAEVGQNGDANSQTKEGSGAFVVYTNNADTISGEAGASLAERMRVDYQGYVGIGTSSPSNKTHITSSVSGTTPVLRVENSNSDGLIGFKRTSGSPSDDYVLGADSTRMYFRNNTTSTDLISILEGGNVGIGTTSPTTPLHVEGDATVTGVVKHGANQIDIYNSDQMYIKAGYAGSNIIFYVGSGTPERMRIDNSGTILMNKTVNNFNTAGVILNAAGNCFFTASGNSGVNVNRLSDDGALVRFYQDNGEEGSISVSGATVSYNGFTGTHWSRLSDNSKPTILKGTILESLDEMMDWYQVQFDITDEEGNTRTEKQSYALGDGESVGDVITYNYEGTDYQATIIQEGDVKHTKSKISDTVDAKNVYGVFMAWDNDDDTVNDMYVAQTGTFVVRMNGSETVSKGDLIQSNGDGTGKVQADDIIRASTVAKVLSTTKIETYDDGSYIVPCSLHC